MKRLFGHVRKIGLSILLPILASPCNASAQLVTGTQIEFDSKIRSHDLYVPNGLGNQAGPWCSTCMGAPSAPAISARDPGSGIWPTRESSSSLGH